MLKLQPIVFVTLALVSANSPVTAQQASPGRATAPSPGTGGVSYQQVAADFNQWISVQEIYPKSKVPQIKKQFEQKAKSLAGSELQQWLSEMNSKMALLASPQAQAAREWLSYFVSAKAVLPERDIRSFDIVNMTTAQLQRTLDDIDSRRQGMARSHQAFDATRQQQVQQTYQQQQERLKAERAENTNRTLSSYYPEYTSQYTPRNQMQNRPKLDKGPTMYVSPWGGVGLILNQ